jgi:hypothetical protein
LSNKKKEILHNIVKDNNFKNVCDFTKDKEVLKVLRFYMIKKDEEDR